MIKIILNNIRNTTLIILILSVYNPVLSQCKVYNVEIAKMYAIFQKTDISLIKRCNFQFGVGAPPDVDNWRTKNKTGCVTKTQALSLVGSYIKLCKIAKVKNVDYKLIEKLRTILDNGNYIIDMYYEQSNNHTNHFEFYIRNERMWIFMGTIEPFKNNANLTEHFHSENWQEISGIISRFDTTAPYRCSYEFHLGDLQHIPKADSNIKIVYGKITKDQLFMILKIYTRLCLNHNYIKLEKQIIQKLSMITDDDIFSTELRYRGEHNRVYEIYCYIHNQNTSFGIYLFLPAEY